MGNWVYVKLQSYRQQSIAFRNYAKLAPSFFGPFEITTKLENVAYCVDLLPGSRIHNVFHVSFLRKHFGPIPQSSPQLPSIATYDPTHLPQPKLILDRYLIHIDITLRLRFWLYGIGPLKRTPLGRMLGVLPRLILTPSLRTRVLKEEGTVMGIRVAWPCGCTERYMDLVFVYLNLVLVLLSLRIAVIMFLVYYCMLLARKWRSRSSFGVKVVVVIVI